MLIDQLHRHLDYCQTFPSQSREKHFQNGPRKTRKQVNAMHNRALLMYSSAVVRHFYLTSTRQWKSHDHIDSSYWCLLRSSSTISYVLCRDWFFRNAKSWYRSIWAIQTCSSRECPPDKGLFQRRSFWSAWSFRPQQKYVHVLPGESSLAFYTAKNMSDKDIIGIATYNVMPDRVCIRLSSIFLGHKWKCFTW